MSTPRDEILTSIRQNLAASVPFDAIHREHHSLDTTEPEPLIADAERESIPPVERFRENLISIGGNCLIVKDESDAARAVQDIVAKIGARRIAISDSPLIHDLSGQLPATATILTNATKEELFACDAGITSAQWAIAETGTLVLESERESHRLASLVPPVHICLLRAANIRHSMGEILEIVNPNGPETLSRTITFITGPSRTSDIELTLAIGVHGPRELHVIII